jgi:hypothetical protein
LTVFLEGALSKKYTNPSSDIIAVLAGLHDADHVMSDFVAALDAVIRSGRSIALRRKAICTTLAMTAAGFNTVLPSYLTHRDLFPALMKYVQDCDARADVVPAFYLLGLLVNYNKFEFQNPYRLRLDDFVNDVIIQKMVGAFGYTCTRLRDAYVAVQDDMPEAWTLGSTLNYFGLGVLAPASRPATPTPGPDEAKSLFAALYVVSMLHQDCRSQPSQAGPGDRCAALHVRLCECQQSLLLQPRVHASPQQRRIFATECLSLFDFVPLPARPSL